MKFQDIEIGGKYTAKVSGKIVEVVVLTGGHPEPGRSVRRFTCRNIETGRIVVKTAAALRTRVLTEAELQAAREVTRAQWPFIDGAVRSAGALFGRRTSAAKRGSVIGLGVIQ